MLTVMAGRILGVGRGGDGEEHFYVRLIIIVIGFVCLLMKVEPF